MLLCYVTEYWPLQQSLIFFTCSNIWHISHVTWSVCFYCRVFIISYPLIRTWVKWHCFCQVILNHWTWIILYQEYYFVYGYTICLSMDPVCIKIIRNSLKGLHHFQFYYCCNINSILYTACRSVHHLSACNILYSWLWWFFSCRHC